ncbi:PREDICTED: uncharacterized protein LOC104596606 isoform X2 [Nelumbo nucifera]|uniref:EGF-like domain-containing protein n=2 Tax=Nelumbo nucifera TaxID=4432 RepID=A0A822XKG8_NELNU|nr:PREDICTED: uncharacterized protein LOC104596606 isoform X2 [Nelumbo nucifera]DAD19631.1 TPA_asm: hypothetical protein HUJ06_021094 [Nelumbo nucifera]
MASSSAPIVFLAIVVFIVQPITAWNDALSPLFSPVSEEICKEVNCGKGTCKPWSNAIGYTCECDAGWKRTRFDNETEDYFKYLPCVIPKCTLDYSCSSAPPPLPDKEVPHNSSFWDPCYWAYCGEGTCVEKSNHVHVCDCKEGFYNLLNVSVYPCFSECTLGADCESLGISVSNKSASQTPGTSVNLSDNGAHGTSGLPGSFNWLMVLMISLAMIFWK